MATKIRLKRIGRRNRPFYRLVVMDSRKRRDGAAIEQVGWYNPIDPSHSFDLKGDRIIYWLGEGAIPTDAAQKLIRRSGLAHRWHLMKQGLNEIISKHGVSPSSMKILNGIYNIHKRLIN